MKVFGLFFASAFLVAVALLATIYFVPSYETIDVSAKTDFVSFKTAVGVVTNSVRLGVLHAKVCGYNFTAVKTPVVGTADDCLGREMISKDFTGPIKIVGGATVILRRTDTGAIEMVIRSDKLPMLVFVGTNAARQDGAIIIAEHQGSGGNLISFGALASSVTIGQTGVDQNKPAELLVSGTLRALATTSVTNSVVSGPTIPLGLGDVVDLLNSTSNPRGNIFVRAGAPGPLDVTVRYPAASATIARFGGSGVQVEFSWWDRILAEPLLIAIWASIGFWFAVLGMILKVTEVLRDENKKKGNVCCRSSTCADDEQWN